MSTPNIEVRWHTETVELLGNEGVEGVKVRNLETGVEDVISATGFFVAIWPQAQYRHFQGSA